MLTGILVFVRTLERRTISDDGYPSAQLLGTKAFGGYPPSPASFLNPAPDSVTIAAAWFFEVFTVLLGDLDEEDG